MKQLKLISLLLALITLLSSLTSCNMFGKDKGEEAPEENDDLIIDQEYLEINFDDLEIYKVKQYTPEKQGSSYVDGAILYHTFKVGKIENVPIYSNFGYYHDGRTNSAYEWEESEINETAFTDMQENCVSNALSTSVKVSTENSVTAGAKFSYAGFEAGVEAKTSTVFEASTNASVTSSASQSFSHTISDRVEKTQRRTVTIDKSSPAGHYTYTIFANVDVYVTLVCNTETGNIDFTYFSVPREKTYFDTFYYSKYNDFDVDPDEKLTLSVSDFAGFDFFDATGAKKVTGVKDALVYSNATTTKITDTGAYGLEQGGKQALLDLSRYAEYMTDDYKFTFSVTVSYEAESTFFGGGDGYVDGYKQMFLYKSDPGYLSDSIDRTNPTLMKSTYGMLYEEEWTEDKGEDVPYTWEVIGNDCTNEMCVRFDAYGDGDDTWYLKSLIITLTVTLD